jgi:hypothetical protein
MKRTILTLSLIGLLLIQSCSTRNDIVFSASDEIHYIILYEKGSDFKLLYNGVNTASGTYKITSDTIHLTYTEDQFEAFDPNEKLTRQILIEKVSNSVKSVDKNMYFRANIDIDKRIY